ncbi:MAG: hypothetical protein COB98_07170 [Flavobacteriaceae bacterium]|nr:MAG: hypothetical protein COB98_07170 [Flavobacteriaceae bacterium]
MKTRWLNKEGNTDCILFFNGWGMDENTVNHLDRKGFDICMFYDYKTIHPEEIALSSYSRVYVVSWSLGVWVTGFVIDALGVNVSKSIALNGTQLPVDLCYGIPPQVFENTFTNWDERNRKKFNRRVLGGKSAFELYEHKLVSRNVVEQQVELGVILKLVKQTTVTNFCFDTALIGQQDLIFSPENQWEFWKRKAMVVEFMLPHYPFNYFNSWKQIISL